MARSFSRVILWCGLLSLPAAAGGCQNGSTWNLAPVEGTVTKDGRPLANIQVVFLAELDASTKGPRASGFTDEAGHYDLHTDAGDRGAANGRYRVCLCAPRWMVSSPGKTRSRQADLPKEKVDGPSASDVIQLPPTYALFAKTPLRAEVRSGPQVIDFDINFTDAEIKLIGVQVK
jgi:hypothetical protein